MPSTGMTVGLIKALAPKPSVEDISTAVGDWLDDHPEATTTVQDGVITRAKLDSTVGAAVDSVADLNNDIDDLTNKKANIITESTNYQYVAFSCGSDNAPMRHVVAQITPVQSGTGDPSPSNVRPITGWTGLNVYHVGINLFNEQWEQGDIQTGSPQPSISALRSGYINVRPSSTYYIYTPRSSNVYVFEYAKEGEYANKVNAITLTRSFTTSPTTTKVRIVDRNSGTETIQTGINFPQSIMSYHVYEGQTYSISWQTEAGTVYGGELDVLTGLLTVTDAKIASYNGETLPGEWISDRDVYISGTTPTAGAQVVYKLATPITYQLAPTEINTIYGHNYIFTDTGDIYAEYPIDIKLYIVDAINRTIEAAIAPIETGPTASRPYSQGHYFFIGKQFCIAKTSIAKGATLTKDTNYEITRIGPELFTALRT